MWGFEASHHFLLIAQVDVELNNPGVEYMLKISLS